MPKVPGLASAFLTTCGFLEKNGRSALGAPRPVPSPTSQPLLGRMETLRLEYRTAGSRASAAPTCEGLWGAGVFWNVQSWPLWVCGKEREAKVHMGRGQFCQSEEKQTACVRTPRLAWPSGVIPPRQSSLTQPVGKRFPQELVAGACPPPLPPSCL